MAKYTAEVQYIASIWPGKLEPITLYHGPSPDPQSRRATTYRLQPVPRGGKAFVLEVSDAFENIFNPMSASGQSANRKSSKPVDVNETVGVLLNIWAGNIIGVPEGASPGIIKIVGTIPQKAEAERMRESQTVFAEHMFQQGELHHRQNQWKEITQVMRDMAIWLEKDVLWANPAAASELINCVACGELVKPTAAVCRHCGMRLKALPPEIEALNAGRARAPETVVA